MTETRYCVQSKHLDNAYEKGGHTGYQQIFQSTEVVTYEREICLVVLVSHQWTSIVQKRDQ